MVQVPLSDAVASSVDVQRPSPAPRPAARPSMENRIVFLVENDGDLRRAMGLLLEKWGVSVLDAASGEEALALIDELGILPDCFIVDHNLGDGMDGLRFLAVMRERHGDVAARIMTADRRARGARCLRRGGHRGDDETVRATCAGGLCRRFACGGVGPAYADTTATTTNVPYRAALGPLTLHHRRGMNMQLSDFRDIKADPATVWAAILNPDVLKECVPGCESMTGSPEEGFEAVVTQKVGPVKATFKGAVSISDRIEGKSLKISGEGKGGPAGFAKGSAAVTLEPSEARHAVDL